LSPPLNQIASDLRQVGLDILRRLQPYWLKRAITGDQGIAFQYQDGHAGEFSARLLSDVMLGFLALALVDGCDQAISLTRSILREVLKKQDPSGAFRWNLPDPNSSHPLGVRDQVDLAMVLDAYGLLQDAAILNGEETEAIQRSVVKAIDYLRTAGLRGRPGIIRKRHYEDRCAGLDVLNGDALAAKAYYTARRMGLGSVEIEEIRPFLTHLAERFGRHHAGWWVYCESLADGANFPPDRPGYSLFFQAMTLVHLRPLVEDPHFSEFGDTAEQAMASVISASFSNGRLDERFESRPELHGKPNALVATCLALSGEAEAERKALARLEFIRRYLITDTGDVRDERGHPVSDVWRIWLFSDVARYVLDFVLRPTASAQSLCAAI
jgi:hypothetical protein